MWKQMKKKKIEYHYGKSENLLLIRRNSWRVKFRFTNRPRAIVCLLHFPTPRFFTLIYPGHRITVIWCGRENYGSPQLINLCFVVSRWNLNFSKPGKSSQTFGWIFSNTHVGMKQSSKLSRSGSVFSYTSREKKTRSFQNRVDNNEILLL